LCKFNSAVLNKNIAETQVAVYLTSVCKNLMKSRITILVKQVVTKQWHGRKLVANEHGGCRNEFWNIYGFGARHKYSSWHRSSSRLWSARLFL